LGGLPGI